METAPAESPARRDPFRGFLYALIATIVMSGSVVLGKFGMQKDGGFNPATFAFLWVGSGAAYCFIALAITGRLGMLRIPRRSVRMVVLISAITGINQYVGWTGVRLLDPSFAAFLNRTAPVFIILCSVVFLGERLRRAEVAAFVVILAGGCISAIKDWHNADTRTGMICIIVACLVVGAQRVLIKICVRRVEPMAVNFYRALGGAITVGTVGLLSGAIDFSVGGGHWAAALTGGLTGPCISVSLLYTSYRLWDLSKSTMLMMIQPLLVLPLAYVWLGMVPTRWQFGGGLIILAGGFWLVWMHGRRHALQSAADFVR